MFSVALGQRPQILPTDSYNRIQRRGINYEKRALRDLIHQYGWGYTVVHGQWLYHDRGFCQPDILVIPDRGPLLVLEVKLTRKGYVEKKLRDVYMPLVASAFPNKEMACGQIYRNGDRSKPDSVDLTYFLSLKPNHYGEVQWS